MRGWPRQQELLSGAESWRLGFYAYALLSNMVFGMYIVASRDLVKQVLGNDYSFISFLIAAENMPAIFSVVAGGLSDVLGRKGLILLGLAGVPALALMYVAPIDVLPVLAGTYVTFWTISIPSVMGTLLDRTRSSSMHYSIYAMFGSVGWGLSGVLAGFLAGAFGDRIVFVVAAALLGTGLMFAYATHPGGGGGVSARDVLAGAKLVLLPLLAAATSIAAADGFYGVFSLKLRDIAGSSEVFGLLYTTLPALVGVFARPAAGVVTERLGALRSFFCVVASYAVVLPLMAVTSGPVAVMFWILPLWPFLDQSMVMLISRSLPGCLQGLAAGVVNTAYSLAGLLVLMAALTPAFSSLYVAAVTALFFLGIASLALFASRLRH